jgi:hypothetical protein
MAWGVIQKPGAKYGPCKKACAHLDCAAGREIAAKVCPECDKPIGYDTPFAHYTGKAGLERTYHNLCLEIMAENEQKERKG